MSWAKHKELLAIPIMLLFGVGAFAGIYALVSRDEPVDSVTEQASTPTDPEVYEVPLDSANKMPINTQVRVGDHIQFNSADGKDHQVTQAGEGEHANESLDSGVFGPGKGFRVQFNDEGTFVLRDTYNPETPINVQVVR